LKLYLVIFTALLICLENTFWNISEDHNNFVELFKKSFMLYVESGMRKKMEAVLDDNVRYGDGGVTRGFKEKLHGIIMEHLLPHPKYQVFESEQKKVKMVTWLRNLVPKICGKQRV